MSAQKSKSEKASAARERVAAMREEEERRERRQKLLIYGVAGVVLVVLIALIAWQVAANRAAEGQLDEEIEGLEVYEDLPANHVPGTVDYEAEYGTNPPAGGDHADSPQWLNCGIYDAPVGNENAVHSMEHGAVWITYQPDLPEGDVDALRDVVGDLDASERNYVILSPYDGLPAPVVASAWGHQVFLDGAEDVRLEQFLHQYVRGPQTPEPGAVCSQGVGTPID